MRGSEGGRRVAVAGLGVVSACGLARSLLAGPAQARGGLPERHHGTLVRSPV